MSYQYAFDKLGQLNLLSEMGAVIRKYDLSEKLSLFWDEEDGTLLKHGPSTLVDKHASHTRGVFRLSNHPELADSLMSVSIPVTKMAPDVLAEVNFCLSSSGRVQGLHHRLEEMGLSPDGNSTFRLFHLSMEDPGRMTMDDMTAALNAQLGHSVSEAIAGGHFREVAVISASSIDEIFRLSNHIDDDWTQGASVLRAADARRSTSVGDIAMDVSTGDLYACASIGWKPLTESEAAIFRGHLGDAIQLLEREPVSQPPEMEFS